LKNKLKNNINIGDLVYFLYAQHLQSGTVTRINKKTISIAYIIWGWNGQKGVNVARKKLVKKDRVVHANDEFTIVWEMDIGVEGRYYITHDEFPEENGLARKWHQPYTYITK